MLGKTEFDGQRIVLLAVVEAIPPVIKRENMFGIAFVVKEKEL